MLRTIFVVGLLALGGLVLLKLFFGLVWFGFALIPWLIGVAVKALVFGAVAYLVIRIVSPETARRLRRRFSESPY